jgi:WD40 repeat protein
LVISMPAAKKIQIRYEEYASYAPPRHSARQAHAQNDEYMEKFEDAFNSQLKTSDRAPEEKIPQASPSISISSFPTPLAPTEASSSPWIHKPSKSVMVTASPRPLSCLSVFGAEAVVGSCDHALYVFDIYSGKRLRQLHSKKHGHSEWVTSVAHSRKGHVLSGAMDSKLCLWGPKSASCVDLTGHSGSISKVAVLEEGRAALSSSYDKTLRLWDLSTRASSALRGHKSSVLDFALHGTRLVSGDRDGVCILWDVSTGAAISKLRGHTGHITALSASDGLFFSGAQDGDIRVWDPRQASCVKALSVHASEEGRGAVSALRCGSASTLVSGGADGRVQVLEMGTFAKRHSIDTCTGFIYSMELHGDVCLVGGNDGELAAFDMQQGEELYRVKPSAAAVRAIWPTDDCIVTAGDDGTAAVLSR